MRTLTALSLKLSLAIVLNLVCFYSRGQNVYTVAGTAGVSGSNNGVGSSASFNNPYGIAADGLGNIYVANRFGHTIRKIDLAGNVSTYAGTGMPGATDGAAATATFNEPWSVSCDSLGNVYVADTKNYKIRKISSTGQVSTVAGIGTFGVTNGIAALAQFGFPSGVTVTPDGTTIYVSDRMTNTIRKITGGMVTTFAGMVYAPGSTDGQGAAAKFDHPNGLAIDGSGNVLVADEFNNKIRRISTAGYVTTVAGSGASGNSDGPALQATFKSPWGLCVLNNGDILVGDADNFTIRKISGGVVSLYAGQPGQPGMINGPALQSSFNGVSALCVNGSNNQVYLCDPYSHLVRKIAPLVLAVSIQGGNTFCQGASVNIQVSPSGLSNYKLFVDGQLAGSSVNGSFTLNSLVVGQHSVTATASTATGATVFSDPYAVVITQGLNVSIIVNGSNTICAGDTVTLSSSMVGAYQWSNGSSSPSIQVSNAGTYTLTVTNGQGCSGTSPSQQVLTLQPPAATISSIGATSNCPGDTVVLTAGQAPQYLWSNGAITQSIAVTGAGNYNVTVSNSSGCSATSLAMSVNYHPVSYSSVAPSGNVLVVQGSQTTLMAGAGTGYAWSTGSTSQSIVVSSAGSYTVTVTDNNGCSSVPATVSVSYLSANNLVSVQGATSFCQGDSVVFSSSFNSHNQWYKNGAPIQGATNSTYVAKTSGTYQLRYAPPVSTAVFSDTISVNVLTLPTSLNVTSSGVCPFSSAILQITPESGISYTWYDEPAGGAIVNQGAVFATPVLEASVSYFVLQANAQGCVAETTIEVVASVYDAPTSAFTYGEAQNDPTGFRVEFQSPNDPGTSYYWDFGDLGSANNYSNLPSPEHIYPNTGTFVVTCIATNANGCSDTTMNQTRVALPDNLFIPNSFTPDNDGQNDLFRVRGNNIVYADMSVFDQWGKRIWSADKTANGWNGESANGLVPVGTYNYAVKVYLDNGATSFHRGSINLIR